MGDFEYQGGMGVHFWARVALCVYKPDADCSRICDRSSNKMPAAVKKAIQDAAVSEGCMAETEAKGFVNRLEREGRLFEECWS